MVAKGLDPEVTMRRLDFAVRFVPAIALVGLLAAGCGDDPPPKSAADIPTGTGKANTGKKDTATPTSGSVHIEDKITKACGDLPTANFAFDSAEIAGDAANALDALARCFVSGPLKGKGMKLVGHADPRGETEYNFGLGQRRAGGVAGFLSKKGLEQGRMATSSKGELEASGVDESGWARDRKVDILLAD
jgi:peptidoglycan-associated lipoprotein